MLQFLKQHEYDAEKVGIFTSKKDVYLFNLIGNVVVQPLGQMFVLGRKYCK